MKNLDIAISKYLFIGIIFIVLIIGCSDDEMKPIVLDPDLAEVVSVDRFSDVAGNLMKRSNNALLPATNEPIIFDQGDFITQSFGPDGQIVRY